MPRVTLSIEEHPRGGYCIKYPRDTYETVTIDNTDPSKATQFKDYIAVSSYIEGSWPAYSEWEGRWIDNTHYSIKVD